MYMYFENVTIIFSLQYAAFRTLLEHLNIISRTKELAYACTVSSCAHNAHKGVPAPLAR